MGFNTIESFLTSAFKEVKVSFTLKLAVYSRSLGLIAQIKVSPFDFLLNIKGYVSDTHSNSLPHEKSSGLFLLISTNFLTSLIREFSSLDCTSTFVFS